MSAEELRLDLQASIEWGEIEAARTPARLFALKDRDTFLVADGSGDVAGHADGLFHDDTRILSRWRLLVGGGLPTLLTGSISHDNVIFTSHTLNAPMPSLADGALIPAGVIHVERKRFLWEERLYERLSICNYADVESALAVAVEFDADFRDIFEVRGARRRARGRTAPPDLRERLVRFAYEGLDGVTRSSVIAFSRTPDSLTARGAEFRLTLAPRAREDVFIEVCAGEALPPSRERHRVAALRARLAMRARRRRGGRVMADNRLINAWTARSRADVALLTTHLETGPYPYAGIPWFSTPFGRDGIFTAWQFLWIDPALAEGVLTFLATHQAEAVSAFRDSEPGKILHETRRGEMAALGEIPFGRYYGGVDTTPLFVALAGAYHDRTGDRALIERLWPALERAAAWVRRRCEGNPHGLLDYARGADSGLSNQGWKDSGDSVFHADGRTPPGPIALVEVQGYAHRAYQTMQRLCALRGDAHGAAEWGRLAESLAETVERMFWMDDLGFYGLAVDGEGELCRVRTSNAGHLLFSGLPGPARARRVGLALAAPDFASGWGLRTVATDQARFNPMSYHNGSIWPHDTAIAAMGMARYGLREEALRLTSQTFEAAREMQMRLPELYCGFPRSAVEPPVPYPVACTPQAWAAGSVFMLLQACLGVTVNGATGEVEVREPRLPDGVDRLCVERLQVGGREASLVFERRGGAVRVRAEGPAVTLKVREAA